MLARCARCQGTFSTDRFGVQTCPHCGSELLLADPKAPGAPPPAAPGAPSGEAGAPGSPPAPPAWPPPASPQPSWGAPPPPPEGPPAPPPPPGAGAAPPAWPPSGGWPPAGGPPGGGWGPPPGPAAPPPGDRWHHVEAGIPAPFAERKARGFFGAFFETWRLAALEPARFFRYVRIDQTGAAVWFAVIAGTVGTWVQLAFFGLTAQGSLRAMQEAMRQIPDGGNPEAFRFLEHLFGGPALAAMFVVTPLTMVIRIYVTAAIAHLLLLLFRGARRGFDATLTAVGYASAVYLLNAVPGCGGPIAFVWFVVVAIIGLGEAHRCGAGRAAAAMLAPLLIATLCCCGVWATGFGKMLHDASEHGTTTTSTKL